MPADHPDKAKEGGSQSTPGEFIDWLLDVVEACDRVLAPHGSLCIELGDTYAGSGGAGGDYAEHGLREGQPTFKANRPIRRPGVGRDGHVASADHKNTREGLIMLNSGGTGWPLAKSLSLIPESFRFAMVYGFNPHTGRTTEPWRLRNVIRWVRPNPPVGALGDKFRPATSELMVFCKSAKRYFDLDAVREPYAASTVERGDGGSTGMTDNGRGVVTDVGRRLAERKMTHAGAPPLDWWNIPLLEGEEETRYGPKEKPKSISVHRTNEKDAIGDYQSRNRGGSPLGKPWEWNPLGAPPLDWWEIPPGGYSGTVTTKVKVPVEPSTYDGFSGDIQCTVSADCPMHGDRPDPEPTGLHDGRGATSRGRNPDTGSRPVPTLGDGSVPTDQLPLPTPEGDTSGSLPLESIPAATPRSKASNRTAPVPATSPPGTSSGRTRRRIDDTPAGPLSDGPHPDTPENKTSEDDADGVPQGTPGRIADTETPPSDVACTCSYWVEKVDTTSHYAVFPPELCVKPVKAMSPERVCRTCGEPSRRIVSRANATDERQALADYLRSQREAAGISVKELAAHFPSVSGGMTGCVWNWENAANVPTAEQWPTLKGLLALDDRFDELVTGERTWTESEVEYEYVNNDRAGLTQDAKGKMYRRLESRQNRIAPDRFSDCGHDDWRPGLVLDPFAGSGTTLAVATGHGRDAIGVDLDSRNFDLALERVGPFILSLGNSDD